MIDESADTSLIDGSSSASVSASFIPRPEAPLPNTSRSVYTRPHDDSHHELIQATTLEAKELEAFFDGTSDNSVTSQFLHRPSIFADWNQGRLDPTLAATLCVLGRLAIHNITVQGDGDDVGLQHARDWLSQV